MNFDTERVSFRKLKKEDFPLFYSLFSNEQVMRYAWIDRFDSEETAYPCFENFLGHKDLPGKNNTYAFACFSAGSGEFIAFADIELQISNSRSGCGEIGYFLLPEYWGRGYASEIARGLIAFGFTGLKLHKVCARCDSNNLRSEGVMIKAGMTKEGELRKVRYKSGVWDDEKHYGILLEEWKKQAEK